MGPRRPSSRTLNICATVARVVSASPLVIGPESVSDEAQRPSDGAQQAAHGTSSAASGSGAALATLADAAERANHYAGRSKSPATIAAYAAGWRDFLAFCQLRGREPLPATDQTVADYLAELADAGLKAATIARRLVVISQAHKAADLPSPTTSSLVSRTHAGIRRALGTAQQGKALPGAVQRRLQPVPPASPPSVSPPLP